MRDVKPTWHGAAFVCTHNRDLGDGKACCGLERGTELRNWLKDKRGAEGLKGQILIAKSGCLGICSKHGVTISIMPDEGRGHGRQMLVFGDGDDREALWSRIRAGLMGD